jgi:hypothetical protein
MRERDSGQGARAAEEMGLIWTEAFQRCRKQKPKQGYCAHFANQEMTVCQKWFVTIVSVAETALV